jgi:hypothetical protein
MEFETKSSIFRLDESGNHNQRISGDNHDSMDALALGSSYKETTVVHAHITNALIHSWG